MQIPEQLCTPKEIKDKFVGKKVFNNKEKFKIKAA